MPRELGKDKKGCFARWGKHGTKYYYKCGNKKSRQLAIDKAEKQGRAIFMSRRRNNGNKR